MESHSTVLFLSILLITFFIFSFNPQPCSGARLIPYKPTNFIRTSCSSTTYPTLCFSSLATYANKIQTSPTVLANTSLSVTLDGTRTAYAAMNAMAARGGMSRPVAGAMSDCVETMGDSVDELRQSLGEMRQLGGRGENLGYQISNIQTWVSAALTDADTCMDGFDGNAMDGDVKNAVRTHVVKVAQLASNALALVSRLVNSAP